MEGDLIYVSLEKAKSPKSGRCTVGKWWVVHPEKGLAFYKTRQAPQCHELEWYIKKHRDRCFPNHDVQKIECAFV